MKDLLRQSPFKAIIFDCDGTLIDSEEAHFVAWQKTSLDFSFEIDQEEYFSFVGKPDLICAELVAKKINFHCPTTLLSQKRKHFHLLQQKGLPPIAGTVEFIHKLYKEKDQSGLKLAVASAAFKDEILSHLKSLQIENYFDVILSGQEDLSEYNDPTGVNKPKPYIYQHTAKLLGVSPEDCIVIEDSHTGVTAGVQAGCFTVAIPHAYSLLQDFSSAHLIVDSLLDHSTESFLNFVSDRK